MATNDKTIIKFRFKRPGGFSVSGHGNFTPELKPTLLTPQEGGVPLALGNTWVIGYDYSQTYPIELESEQVRPLPQHILDATDEETRLSFKQRAATEAAEAHGRNNAKRDELAYHASTGLIEIVSDSFFAQKSPEPRKVGRPAKDTTEVQN